MATLRVADRIERKVPVGIEIELVNGGSAAKSTHHLNLTIGDKTTRYVLAEDAPVETGDSAPEAIPPYDPDAICPRCGKTPVGTKVCGTRTPDHNYGYWSSPFFHWPTWVYVEGAHLHRECGRCQHSWIELALDARMLTGAEAKELTDEWMRTQAELDEARKVADSHRWGGAGGEGEPVRKPWWKCW